MERGLLIREWYFGFHRPMLRHPRLWLGHCEAWGCADDDTWLFIDPQGVGLIAYTAFLYDDVQAQLRARLDLCDEILRLPAPKRGFRVPLHGPMTCASVCGSLVGIRALVPWTLRRSLLAKGAEVVHETEGKSGGYGGAAA